MQRADLDWGNLGFGVTETDFTIVCRWRQGGWSKPEVQSKWTLELPITASALHYGQSVFEGMKAFETVDGRIALFRPDQNAKRMHRGAQKLLMAPVPEEMFVEVVEQCIRLNRRFVPPSDSGAALYVRPLLFGSGPVLGVKPASEYTFLVFVTPVGPYFKGGFKPINLVVEEEVHRAAPLGVGDVKAAGNYAASMRAGARAKERGFANVVYLDAREGRYVDETGATNFYGIKRGARMDTYVTPHSQSILPSITNASLMTLAHDLGLNVERRPLDVAELEDLSEAGCCGTAAVITPVGQIQWRDRLIDYGDEPGPWTQKLYDTLCGIQRGELPDTHGWLSEVCC